jgi:transposase
MTLIELSYKERRVLEHLVRNTSEANTLRRVQALLWLDDGQDVEDVADQLYVSRLTVYKWVRQFKQRDRLDFCERVSDGRHSGRPCSVKGIIDPMIDEIIDKDPRDLGYNLTVWTAPVLVQYLEEFHNIVVSTQSVRLAIRRLEIRWKRPRHQLALRPETWRQAKGG